MCTEKYAMPTNANLGSTCTHLTNYSINKDSEAFVQPEDVHDDTSHKRTVSSLMETLRGLGHDTDALWEAIGQLVVKTLVAVQPHLEHTYFTCRQRSNDAGFGCFRPRRVPPLVISPRTAPPRAPPRIASIRW